MDYDGVSSLVCFSLGGLNTWNVLQYATGDIPRVDQSKQASKVLRHVFSRESFDQFILLVHKEKRAC